MVHTVAPALVPRWNPAILISDAATPSGEIDKLGYRGPAKFLAPELRFGDPVPALVTGRDFAVLGEAGGLNQASLYLSDYSLLKSFGTARALRPLPDAPVLVAANAVHWNYWHWLFQCLAPILVARARGLKLRLLLPELGRFARDSLSLAGIAPDDVIALQADEVAVVPSAITTNLTTGEHAFLPHPEVVRLLEALAEAPPWSRFHGCKLYFTRDSAKRTIINESALITALEERGFHIVRGSELSFVDQVAAFRDARLIVSSHGAALANLAFCHGSDMPTVVELQQENYLHHGFLKLAQVKRMNYSVIVSRMADPGSDGRHFSTSEADIPLILAHIDRL